MNTEQTKEYLAKVIFAKVVFLTPQKFKTTGMIILFETNRF